MAIELSPELLRVQKVVDRSGAAVFGVTGTMMLFVPAGPVALRLLAIPSIVAACYFSYRSTRSISPSAAAVGLTVCLATAIAMPLLNGGPYGSFGFSACASVLVARKRRHRAAWCVLVVAVAAGSGALIYFARPAMTATYVWVALIFAGTSLFTFLLGHRSWQLSVEVEARQRSEQDLALARERFRFAADLHDIQGHTLHVVKLKAALALKLVRTDPARAEDELGQIHELIAGTIAQTRELASAERRLSLAGELANAENLLTASGAQVTVRRTGELAPGRQEMASLVLREATTNILRHSRASRVRIDVTEGGIEVASDGAPAGQPVQLSGLAVLRERLEQQGATLHVEQGGEQFSVRAGLSQVAAGHGGGG